MFSRYTGLHAWSGTPEISQPWTLDCHPIELQSKRNSSLAYTLTKIRRSHRPFGCSDDIGKGSTMHADQPPHRREQCNLRQQAHTRAIETYNALLIDLNLKITLVRGPTLAAHA